MNATNRGANRVILLLSGLLLLVAGGGAVAASLWPEAGKVWKGSASTALTWMADVDRGSRISDETTLSWFVLGILGLLLLIPVVAAVVIARLGGGRSSSVIRIEPGAEPQGAVTIRQEFASDAITHSLVGHEEILSSRVSAGQVRGTDVLHVSVTPRQNASPADIAATVSGLVDRLALLTGRSTPAFISIRSSVRARIAADQPRVT